MVRALVIIMIATLVLAIGCFGGAAALGGRELAANGWVWPEKWREFGIQAHDGDHGVSEGATGSKELAWVAGPTLQIDLQADVDYIQGEETKVEITGPQSLIDRVAFEGDRLYMTEDGPTHHSGRRPFHVVVTAPSVKRFVLNGAPKLTVSGYDQDELSVEINGAGDVTASGRAGKVAVAISGSGDAELGDVETSEAIVSVAGSGDVRVAPTAAAKVDIAGSGNVMMKSRPANLETNIGGSGDIEFED